MLRKLHRPVRTSQAAMAVLSCVALSAAMAVPAQAAAPSSAVADPGVARGFGVPVAGMKPVTDASGNLHFRPISEQLAFKSCKPLMRKATPGQPVSGWHVSTDDFPTHATRLIVYRHDPVEGDPDTLNCFMPGTYQPSGAMTPQAGETTDQATMQARCARLAHVDFTGWTVEAVTHNANIASAALRSPNGFGASCTLSADPAFSLVWIPQDKPTQNGVTYVQFSDPFDAADVGIAGFAGKSVVEVILNAQSGEQVYATAKDGWYAGAGHLNGPLLGADGPSADAYDADGHIVWHKDFAQGDLLPAECMSSVEEMHGC